MLSLKGGGSGPLRGVRVLELAAQGPAPFSAMLLSDMGADVVRIDRPGSLSEPESAILGRGRRSLALDLKEPADLATAIALAGRADILIEGYRPGAMERLGLGPDVLLVRNKRLVYGRMTGWGQEGPYSRMSGHDMNYVALSGALSIIGPKERPMPPSNLVGDYGGGGTFLTIGVLAALHHAKLTGEGQVVDAAMIDGVSLLMAANYGRFAAGGLSKERDANGDCSWSNIYRCADGEFVAFQAYEARFYREMLRLLGLADNSLFDRQHDRAMWPAQREAIAQVIATKTQGEWCALFDGTDACFAPVLGVGDVRLHPHIRARATLIEVDGIVQPAPAPRFSKTPGGVAGSSQISESGWQDVLSEWEIGG
jgi:alpha-methylacyl-CoA racemase